MNWSNYIILLGGGYMQMPMLLEIKSRGYDVLLIDGNPDCICRQYADQFYCLDTYDIDGQDELLELLLKQNRKPQAILTDAADLGIPVSHLCDSADLPGTPLTTALIINDKAELQHVLADYMPLGLEATGMTCQAALDAWHIRNINPYPLVMKPTNNCGSRGVVKINNATEFMINWPTIEQFQKYGMRGILLQQYIDGLEVATDWFVNDGEPIYVNGARRQFNEFAKELGHTNPFLQVGPQMQDAARALCRITKYKIGPLKIDFIAHNGKWLVLEAATRWSGGFDHGFSAKLATSRNLEAPLLDFALTGQAHVEALITTSLYAAALGLYHGTYDATRPIPDYIAEVHRTQNLGGACAARDLWLLATGETEEIAWQKVLNAQNSLQL